MPKTLANSGPERRLLESPETRGSVQLKLPTDRGFGAEHAPTPWPIGSEEAGLGGEPEAEREQEGCV